MERLRRASISHAELFASDLSEPGDQNQNGQLVLDLAALAYRDGPRISRKTASNQLRQRSLSLDDPDIDLKLFIMPDERFFQIAKRTETLRVKARVSLSRCAQPKSKIVINAYYTVVLAGKVISDDPLQISP